MKIVLMWPHNGPEVKMLIDGLVADGHDILFWIGEHAARNYAPPATIFQDHYDAWNGERVEPFAQNLIPPLSSESIEHLYRVESHILTMMNKGYVGKSVDERKHIYYDALAYWTHVFDTLRPDALVYALIPHNVYNYIAYELALARGIKILCFEEAWLLQRLLPYENFWDGSTRLREKLLLSEGKIVNLDALSPQLQAYYLSTQQRLPTPSYMPLYKSTAEGLGLFKHRIRVAITATRRRKFLKTIIPFIRRQFQHDCVDEYRVVQKNPDWSKPYVYLALSCQPERTTTPQGSVFHDQLLIAQTIAAALPEGWQLYIKEHPSQWWTRTKTRYSEVRYPGYYKRLAAIPNVRIVPIRTSSFELIEKSQAVATASGTAGWEALLRNRSALIFGITWYMDCPGSTRISSVKECRTALERIKRDPAIDQQGVLRFLQAFESVSVDGYLESHATDVTLRKSPEESMRSIIIYLRSALRQSTS